MSWLTKVAAWGKEQKEEIFEALDKINSKGEHESKVYGQVSDAFGVPLPGQPGYKPGQGPQKPVKINLLWLLLPLALYLVLRRK